MESNIKKGVIQISKFVREVNVALWECSGHSNFALEMSGCVIPVIICGRIIGPMSEHKCLDLSYIKKMQLVNWDPPKNIVAACVANCLRYLISHETEFLNTIRHEYYFGGRSIINFADSTRIIDELMIKNKASKSDLDNVAAFKKMNLGLKCWYFMRVWKIAADLMAAENFVELARLLCDDDREEASVVNFLFLVMGINCSRAHFLAQLKKVEAITLMPPLLSIIYDYAEAISHKKLKGEILLLI